ncbi:myb/SANT-like DNA-binding domain-containing protein 4 [Drosophila biarmipes]|uniref:myb/SANT-like DNA-binding domain-containing protein 4 n=1 Tax=Drosophila biarmipes TaxID=125945 RepID=UPI0007E74F66|nr:myb/SANT-like DNA-binding domain-containing protein 4 [Drosophila biarmipes]
MYQMKFPRSRAKNFTPQEERILENLILYHKDVVNSKQNDAKMWSKKAEAWKQIANDFALQSGMERPWQALREKYTNNQRLNRRRFLNVKGEDGLQDDSKSYDGNLSISAVSTLAGDPREEESSTDFDPDYNRSNTLSSTSSDAQFQSETFAHSVLQVKDEPAEDLMDPIQSLSLPSDEKLILIQLQQDFYRCENARAAEKHKLDMEKYKLELEQRKIEIEKFKVDLEKNKEELKSTRLKNELLEMELKERRAKLKDSAPN